MRKYFLNLLLLVAAFPTFSQSVITYPSSGNVATEEWVQNYLFDQLEKYNISDCDLKIDNIAQDGSAIEFGLTSSIQGLNNYSIRIVKNDKTWFWNAVPYQTGERMRIEGVPRLDSVRITIRPTARPTCYVGFNYNLGGGQNPTDPVDPTDPTDPTNPTQPLPACGAGPTILSIASVTQTGLTAQFHGNGVSKIAWQIKTAAGTLARTGEVTPGSPYVTLAFPAIGAGNYTLTFNGVLCTGTSSKNFTVTQGETPVDPTNPTDPIDPTSPDPSTVQPVIITASTPKIIKLSITGSSENWRISDSANEPLQSGYTWWYMINGDIVKTQSNLNNYAYQSNNAGRVLKMALKTQYDSFNKWTDRIEDEAGGYYKIDAGQTLSDNSSSGFVIFTFR